MRLTNLHTGKGNTGLTEALHGKRVEKSHSSLSLYNQSLKVRTHLSTFCSLIENPSDKKFLKEIVINRWMGGFNGSIYFNFSKLGIPSEVSDWMEERIKYLADLTQNAMEFIIFETLDGQIGEEIAIEARELEVKFWQLVKSLWTEMEMDHIDLFLLIQLSDREKEEENPPNPRKKDVANFINTVKLNARFLNLLGDYLFILLRSELKEEEMAYWKNPNQDQEKSDQEILAEIRPNSN